MSSSDREMAPQIDACWNRIGVWSRDVASCPELKQFIHCRNCSRYSAAGRQMLERPAPEDYRLEWTERFTRAKHSEEARAGSVLLFRLGDEWLAMDSHCIKEICEMKSIHSLPHRSDPLLKGLVNIRGELRICISIGNILQLEKSTGSHAIDHEIYERMVLVEKDTQSFVFPVSEVHGIHHYASNELHATPATIAKSSNSFSTGILPWNGHHVGILDHEFLFYALARGLQ